MHNVAAPGQIPHYTYCYTANPPPPPGMGGLGPAHLANPPLGPRLHHDASGQPYYISAIPLPPRFNSPPEAWGERPPCPDQQSCNQVLFGFSGGPAMNYTIFQVNLLTLIFFTLFSLPCSLPFPLLLSNLPYRHFRGIPFISRLARRLDPSFLYRPPTCRIRLASSRYLILWGVLPTTIPCFWCSLRRKSWSLIRTVLSLQFSPLARLSLISPAATSMATGCPVFVVMLRFCRGNTRECYYVSYLFPFFPFNPSIMVVDMCNRISAWLRREFIQSLREWYHQVSFVVLRCFLLSISSAGGTSLIPSRFFFFSFLLQPVISLFLRQLSSIVYDLLP